MTLEAVSLIPLVKSTSKFVICTQKRWGKYNWVSSFASATWRASVPSVDFCGYSHFLVSEGLFDVTYIYVIQQCIVFYVVGSRWYSAMLWKQTFRWTESRDAPSCCMTSTSVWILSKYLGVQLPRFGTLGIVLHANFLPVFFSVTCLTTPKLPAPSTFPTEYLWHFSSVCRNRNRTD